MLLCLFILWCCYFYQHLKRTGWVDNSVTDPETVAGHMYRMAMMAFLFGSGGVGNDTKINSEKLVPQSSSVMSVYKNNTHCS